MNSTAETDTLSEIRAIVKTDDEQVLREAQHLLNLSDDVLVELAGDALAFITAKRDECERTIADDVRTLRIAQAIILRRIVERNAKAIPHDRFVCEITCKRDINKRIDVLRTLEGKVPQDEMQKAIYLKQVEPQWVADATKLKALARKYGGEIAAIVDEGLVYVDGPPTLTIREREETRNVTPTAVNA